jgi:type IV secretory pathway TrbD component
VTDRVSENSKPDVLSIVSYLLALALLLPFAWWLKANELFGLGAWIVSLFH